MNDAEKQGSPPQPDIAGGALYGTMFAPLHTECSSILQAPPGIMPATKGGYSNVTPWIAKLFFAHSYFVYIYVFYMFVFAFYKGYTLEYPSERVWQEMVGIMAIPFFQHLRFYFGFWGCELGLVYDLSAFSFLNAVVMTLLMYFLFFQAYIFPIDSDFLTVAILLVMLESCCGIVNMLPAMKRNLSMCSAMLMFTGIMAVFAAGGAFFCLLIRGHDVATESRVQPHAS
mmetsp:Transcript_58783/g.170546  ORF Transcript_58783/g.170546 Transcript_58783/m.170546 type:complete len:228 (+) Transcript_58783:153-836(+)